MLEMILPLKERLEDAVLRGADSLDGDVMLQHMAKALAPSAAKSPAVARTCRALRAVLSTRDDTRPAKLMDALAAANAAVRALAPADVPGELTPLKPGTGMYIDAPHSRLQPLIDALTGSGSGRLSVLEEALRTRPGDFGDYRVLPYVAAALGDSNEELEPILGAILTAQGKRAVPVLKEGFAPDGRREMERRVYWVARLAGAEENEWYRAMLPDSRREVREMLIAALGLSQSNALLLTELYIGERGRARDLTLRALARMEDRASRDFWTGELERRPDCLSCLEGLDSPLAADMAARALRRDFSEALDGGRRELSQAELLTLAHAVFAAYGKHSPAMRETWLWCAEQIDALDALVPGPGCGGWDMTAAEMLEKCLLETVLWRPCEEVRQLAAELAARRGDRFRAAEVLFELLTGGSGVFERYSPLVVKNGLLRRENAAERAARVQLMRALAALRSTESEGHVVPFARKEGLTGAAEPLRYRLTDFDARWAALLSDPKVNRDGAVLDLSDPWSMKKKAFSLDWIQKRNKKEDAHAHPVL